MPLNTETLPAAFLLGLDWIETYARPPFPFIVILSCQRSADEVLGSGPIHRIPDNQIPSISTVISSCQESFIWLRERKVFIVSVCL